MVNFKLRLAFQLQSRLKRTGVSCGIPTSSLLAAALPARRQPQCWRATAFRVVLVDPHTVYPPDLRCEKLDGPQVDVLRRTGLADAVLRAGTFDGECWIARFGRVVEKRAGDQYGILYDTLVNTIRAEIPASARIHQCQGHRGREQPRPSGGDAVDRRGDFRAPGRDGERAECRPAPRARHDARGREQVSLDHHRVRSQAGRTQPVRFSGADLLRGARRPTASPTSPCSRSARRCAPTSWSIAT